MAKYAQSLPANAEPDAAASLIVSLRTMKAISPTSTRLLLKSTLLAALGGLALLAAAPLPLAAAPAADAAQMQAGKQVFMQICFACHQVNGQGMAGVYPPLAKSDFLLANPDRAVGVLLHGRQGPITVNGRKYNNVMPQLNLSDRQIADVLTYILNSWGNSGGGVQVAAVTQARQVIAAK